MLNGEFKNMADSLAIACFSVIMTVNCRMSLENCAKDLFSGGGNNSEAGNDLNNSSFEASEFNNMCHGFYDNVMTGPIAIGF
jgi:hypothetical protein